MSVVPSGGSYLGGLVARLSSARSHVGRRSRQIRRLWREVGHRGLIDRVRYAVAKRFAPAINPLPVRPADLFAADLTTPRAWSSLPVSGEDRLSVNWITTPPSRGSGGHTTMFRLIEYLERSGHFCRVYLYDPSGGDAGSYEPLLRNIFPGFAGEVHDVANGMADAHAVFATSWQTAYPVYNDPCRGKRFYLVQDFEPWFYPRGAISAFAENTYRMGFHAITAGRFLAEKLRSEYGMQADAFDFGCDTSRYHILEPECPRDGIVFYVRSQIPRRASELGLIALQIFRDRHPDLTIHLYGNKVGKLPFPIIDHGILSAGELNGIYNRCFAGLSLSMTNVSLVPHEMLAAGCIPVVNDAPHNRMVLDNSYVRYTPPTPHAIANALSDVVTTENFAALAASASASVSSASWDAAGAVVEQSLQRELRG
jgi:glycosyltransferase involved in cell wall biosynthesis